MTYLAEKRAALAVGLPWPPPRPLDEPTRMFPPHDWQQVGQAWRCSRCKRSVLETQQPPPGQCFGRR